MLAVLAAHVRLDVVVVLLAVDQVVGAVGRRIVDGLFAFALAFSRAKRRIVAKSVSIGSHFFLLKFGGSALAPAQLVGRWRGEKN